MSRTLTAALLAVLFAFGAGGRAQTFRGKIGVEVEGMWEGARSRGFVDLGKVFRPWEGPSGEGNVPLDADGWPLSDARTVFFDLRPFAAWIGEIDDPAAFMPDWGGTYSISFQGQADLAGFDVASFTVRDQLYNAATNTTTAEIDIAPNTGLFAMRFLNTRRTAGSGTNTGISDLRVIRPGYEADSEQIFSTEFLSSLGPFSTLRFMDFLSTNDASPSVFSAAQMLQWADRHVPSDATQSTVGKRNGFAWEYIVLLANMTGRDIWINIPVHASDDYVRNLAALLAGSLRPEINVYVEHSNEVWNPLFTQYAWNRSAAIAEVNAGDTLLNQGTGDTEEWARRRHARRLVEFSNLFAEAFGAAAINTRVRVVYAHWTIFPDQYERVLDWVNDNYGLPSQFFYAVAQTHYFNGGFVADSIPGILGKMRASSDEEVGSTQGVRDVAASFGLRHMVYEGGPDSGNFDHETSANHILANRAAGIKDVILHDIRDNWFGVTDGLFMYFTHSGVYARFGCWGLTEDIVKQDTFKLNAIKELVGAGEAPIINPGGIVDGAGFGPRVAPGGFMTIFGENFTANALKWDPAIPSWTRALPVMLDGIRVRVNGRDCHIAYVSPTQLNVLIPWSVSGDIATVEVITAEGSATDTVEMGAAAPGFFAYTLNEKLYLAALFNGETTRVAAVGVLTEPSRPARSGDFLQLFTTGLGGTNPAVPNGRVLEVAYPIDDLARVSVTIGGIDAPVLWAGVTFAGVFQVNVQVPAGIEAGDQSVVITVDGRQSQTGAFLTFAN